MVSTGKKLLFLGAVLALVSAPLIASAADHIVDITFLSFEPANITIVAGDKITWTNSSAFFHTATSGSGCVANGTFNINLPSAGQGAYTFNTPGVYPYFCIPHCGSLMTGTVNVDIAVPTEQTTWGAIKALYKPEPGE